MAKDAIERLEEFRKRLRSALANRLTYPKTVIGVAGNRLLTQDEIRKACGLLDVCLNILDAEITLLITPLENESAASKFCERPADK